MKFSSPQPRLKPQLLNLLLLIVKPVYYFAPNQEFDFIIKICCSVYIQFLFPNIQLVFSVTFLCKCHMNFISHRLVLIIEIFLNYFMLLNVQYFLIYSVNSYFHSKCSVEYAMLLLMSCRLVLTYRQSRNVGFGTLIKTSKVPQK